VQGGHSLHLSLHAATHSLGVTLWALAWRGQARLVSAALLGTFENFQKLSVALCRQACCGRRWPACDDSAVGLALSRDPIVAAPISIWCYNRRDHGDQLMGAAPTGIGMRCLAGRAL